jgi:hypothetical protein
MLSKLHSSNNSTIHAKRNKRKWSIVIEKRYLKKDGLENIILVEIFRILKV